MRIDDLNYALPYPLVRC